MKTILIFNERGSERNKEIQKPQKAQKAQEFLLLSCAFCAFCGSCSLSYSGLSGIAMARHMCATGLPSFPKPSFGFLNCRPMMSMNGSIVTTTPGSNAYRSLTVTILGSMYHLWVLSIL